MQRGKNKQTNKNKLLTDTIFPQETQVKTYWKLGLIDTQCGLSNDTLKDLVSILRFLILK